METFKKLKSCFYFLGILHHTARNKIIAFAVNCFFLTIYIMYFLAPLCLVVSTTPTFKQFVENMVFLTISFLVLSWYCICILQKSKYAIFFIDLDEIVTKSKDSVGEVGIQRKKNDSDIMFIVKIIFLQKECNIQR